MKGLEATVVHSSEWRLDNEALRLDSEYQLKAHLTAIAQVRAFGAAQFRDDDPQIIHPQEIIREYVEEEGVWFLRAQNVRPFQIDPRNQVMISKSDAHKLARNVVKRGDVLVTRTGANRGQCAFYDRDELAVASSHTFIVRPKDIDADFLTLFFNTSHGVAQINKGVYGAAQPEVAPYYLRNIWVPKVGSALTARLKVAFERARQLAAFAESSVRDAEAVLVNALGLDDWMPPEPLTYTAKLSDYTKEGRLDAQFHKPKFGELFRLHAARFELFSLDGVVLKGRTVPYVDDGEVPIIRSGDLSDIDDDARFLRAASTEPVFYLRKGDVLISSIGFGSIGKVQVFDKVGKFGTVSEVTVVRQSTLNPYYLATYLRSAFGQMQIDRYITGATGQLHLNPKDVEKFFIPVIPEPDQLTFERLSDEAFKTRSRASALLTAAKRAVEIAIEDGETAAMVYLTHTEEAA